jgi:N-carbamoylputrescine amidase
MPVLKRNRREFSLLVAAGCVSQCSKDSGPAPTNQIGDEPGSSARSSAVRVAAIQMEAELADVSGNLVKAERLVIEASRKGARWAILPEFFTSALAFHTTMHEAVRPLEGEPLVLLRSLAERHRMVVGGSFLAASGGEVYNSFVLAFPGGDWFVHNKDYPTFDEGAYYISGSDDGLFRTPDGPIGSALCWEFVRSATARRLREEVKLVVGGSCWPSPPEGSSPQQVALGEHSLALLKQTPQRFARLVGAPVVHASHAGRFEAVRPDRPSSTFRSYYFGETQIVNARGEILACMPHEDGEGVIIADLDLSKPTEASEPVPDTFWIPEDFPEVWNKAWRRALSKDHRAPMHYARTTKPYILRVQ